MGELPDLSSASLGSVSLANTPRREKQQNKKAPLPRLFVFLLSCCVFLRVDLKFPPAFVALCAHSKSWEPVLASRRTTVARRRIRAKSSRTSPRTRRSRRTAAVKITTTSPHPARPVKPTAAAAARTTNARPPTHRRCPRHRLP